MKFDTRDSRGRAPLLAQNIVATSQPLAAQAGLDAIRKGGNAVDAALAAAITLTVVEPTMNGIGGDGFAMVWDGSRLHGLNASGHSPQAWTPDYFSNAASMPSTGWGSVTVPGVVSGWRMLSERFGRLTFQDLFSAALQYASDGFPVSPIIAHQWAIAKENLADQPGFSENFLSDHQSPKAGERWLFPQQAETLAEIAATKGDSFYQGALARRIVEFSNKTGGVITLSDLASYQAEWVEPMSSAYGSVKIHEIPPNGSGLAAQIALGILDAINARALPENSAQRIHLQIEAMRLAFADVYEHLADRRWMARAPEVFLDRNYLESRAALIDPKRAGRYPAGQPENGGTVYLCTADQAGMMVSYIQSNYQGFGSGVVAPGGIAFHNRGKAFSLKPGHPNQVAPRKRPFHTILPAFLTKDLSPLMAFGVMGGNMQPQGHLQVVMRCIDDNLNPQAAIDSPRWRINDDGLLTVEHSMPENTINGLIALGHQVLIAPPGSLDFGGAQAIMRLETKANFCSYVAGSDPRRDGMAVGY